MTGKQMNACVTAIRAAMQMRNALLIKVQIATIGDFILWSTPLKKAEHMRQEQYTPAAKINGLMNTGAHHQQGREKSRRLTVTPHGKIMKHAPTAAAEEAAIPARMTARQVAQHDATGTTKKHAATMTAIPALNGEIRRAAAGDAATMSATIAPRIHIAAPTAISATEAPKNTVTMLAAAISAPAQTATATTATMMTGIIAKPALKENTEIIHAQEDPVPTALLTEKIV